MAVKNNDHGLLRDFLDGVEQHSWRKALALILAGLLTAIVSTILG